MYNEKDITSEVFVEDSNNFETTDVQVVNDYEQMFSFEVVLNSKEQENVLIDTLDKMEIEYSKKPKERKIILTCTEKQMMHLQRNVKLNLFFNNMRDVSNNITSFVKNSSDVVMQAGITGTSAAIKAGCAVGGSVATAGIALGASVIANGSRTIKSIHKDLKYNPDIKDAKTELKSAFSGIGKLFGSKSNNSESGSGMFHRVG